MAPAMLVVDDEPDIRSSLRMYLAAHLPGVQVLEASDAEEALDIARRRQVDVVLTDFVMPGLDGLELLAQWRLLQPATRTILLTAYPDADVAYRAYHHHGVSQVIAKPAEPWHIAMEAAALLGVQAVPGWSAVGDGVAA